LDWIALDEALFRAINIDGHHPILDYFLPFIRNKYFWAPLYLFLFAAIWINFPRKAWLFILALFTCITISDTLSSEVFKKSVKRLRPCNQEVLTKEVKLLVHCGGGYSFPSSHATNHFAVAFMLILTLGRNWKRIRIPLFIWAGLISFAQIYVGVHFPLDIFGGALLGTAVGIFMAFIYNRLAQKMNLELITPG